MTGRPQRQLKPRSIGAFLLPRAPAEKRVPPMGREGAVEASAASGAVASVALKEA
jgi:hypothetical protein